MHITAVTEEKKDAACKVGVSEAILAPAGAFQALLAEGYNAVINTEKTEELTLPNVRRYSQQGIIRENPLWM